MTTDDFICLKNGYFQARFFRNLCIRHQLSPRLGQDLAKLRVEKSKKISGEMLNRYTVKSCIGGSNPPSPPEVLLFICLGVTLDNVVPLYPALLGHNWGTLRCGV